MTRPLWRKLLRDVRTPLLVVCLLLAGYEMFWVLVTKRVTTEMSPLFRGVAKRLMVEEDSFQKHFFSGPGKAMQSMMGGENIRFNDPQDMLSVGYLHPLVVTIFCLWAVGRAAGAIAGEIDKGTMELLLAQPLSRSRVVAAHLAVDLVVIPLIAISLWLGTWAGYHIAGPFEIKASTFELFSLRIPIEETTLLIDPYRLLPGLLNVMALLFAISGYTMWLSARGRFRNRVVGVAVLVTLVQFIINVIGQLFDGIAFLRPLTVFYYYQPQRIALEGRWTMDVSPLWGGATPVPVNLVVVLLAVGAAGYLLAWRRFATRDIPAPL